MRCAGCFGNDFGRRQTDSRLSRADGQETRVIEFSIIDWRLSTLRKLVLEAKPISESDTVGLFHFESRAQMAILPRMKPVIFYDVAIQVFETARLVINLEPALLTTGRLQNEQGVIHVMAEEIVAMPVRGLPES